MGNASEDHSLLRHSRIIVFMQTAVCPSIISCQEAQVIGILTLNKCTKREDTTVGFNSPQLQTVVQMDNVQAGCSGHLYSRWKATGIFRVQFI